MINFLIAILAFSSGATGLGDPKELEICEQYPKKSETLHCDPDNYLLKFGYHYSRLFVEDAEVFSSKGQIILRDIRHCLAAKLEFDTDLTCENAKDRAQDNHVECYLTSGFCELGLIDLLKIRQRVSKELDDPEFQKTMDRISEGCGWNQQPVG